ncbi:MAG: hypothetical protein V1664_02095 [Candidatus Uhrbacteria bacterium]
MINALTNNRGFVFLEALLAVGLIMIFLSAIGGLFFIIANGGVRIHQSEQANLLAHSGLEALRTVAFDDLSLTSSGQPVFSSPRWTVVAGPETVESFTRTVRVEEVQRDASCNIVATGGTVDPDSKFIESEVVWQDLLGRSHQILLTSLKTRWNDPQGPCFQPSAAASLIFHIEFTYWYGGKQLRELYLENGGSIPFTMTAMTLSWDNANQIQQVFLNSTKIWSAAGPGLPSGNQSSGVRLDIQDYTMNPGDYFEMNKTQFDRAMAGTTLILNIEFSDGSIFTSDPFTPE